MRKDAFPERVEKRWLASMFNSIAPGYDFLNHFLSLGIDIFWRKKALRSISDLNGALILDVASGTADFALATKRLWPKKTVGVDLSNEMLKIGMEKIQRRDLSGWIHLLAADSEKVPFKDATFDAVICAFGVRNFSNLDRALKEMNRVLKSGGKVVILEFSRFKNNLTGAIIRFCFHTFIPIVGGFLSGNHKAYHYLPESIDQFLSPQSFQSKLDRYGFKPVKVETMTFGIVSMFIYCK